MRSKGLDDPSDYVELNDAKFATLDLAAGKRTAVGGVVTYTGVPATLTADGAKGFAGFYPAGTELDPLTVTVAEPGATLPPPGGSDGGGGTPIAGPITPTGLPITGAPLWPLSIAGAALLALGGGLLLGQRHRRPEAPAHL